jgi:hypothetical protein
VAKVVVDQVIKERLLNQHGASHAPCESRAVRVTRGASHACTKMATLSSVTKVATLSSVTKERQRKNTAIHTTSGTLVQSHSKPTTLTTMDDVNQFTRHLAHSPKVSHLDGRCFTEETVPGSQVHVHQSLSCQEPHPTRDLGRKVEQLRQVCLLLGKRRQADAGKQVEVSRCDRVRGPSTPIVLNS